MIFFNLRPDFILLYCPKSGDFLIRRGNYLSILIYIVGTQKNCLSEVCLSGKTHLFHQKILINQDAGYVA